MRLRVLFALLGLSIAALFVAPATAAFGYPPDVCATLSVSTTTPRVGESITVTGAHFDPNSTIQLQLRNPTYNLATVHSDVNGSFSASVTMPANVTGPHLIEAVGGNTDRGPGCPADPSQALDIQGNGGGSTAAPSGGGNGPAFTGVDIAGLIAAAAALLGIGFAVNRSGRRRRAHATRH